MRTPIQRRPALGAALLLVLVLLGEAHTPSAAQHGAPIDAAIAGVNFRFGWGRPTHGSPRFGERGRHEHEVCITDFDEGWDKGALAALRNGYRDGNRAKSYCDRTDSCEPGRSHDWMRGYHAGYAAAYRSAFEFGVDARRHGQGRRRD